MIDHFNRNIHYLRVSVTDRCNLRCRYCMPEDGVNYIPHEEILSYDEITRLVSIMAGLGVNRVRLTGGEPLVRKGIDHLARQIKAISGISFLGLTTNGLLLPQLGKELLHAGVDGLNISLDTLNPDHYHAITRLGSAADALKGLDTALSLGFPSVKVNCVLAPQSTQEDWMSVIALAKDFPIDVRLIEWMPMAGEEDINGIHSDAALQIISSTWGKLLPVENSSGGGPARLWSINGFKGRIGIIHAMSHVFCAQCNRLRLTAAGNLKLCLFYDAGIALKPLLRNGASDEAIAAAINQAVAAKPKQHQGKVLQKDENGLNNAIDHAKGMYQTGG